MTITSLKPTVSNCQTTQIKLCADLNVAALKTHKDKELAMWYCLRFLNATGSGKINLDIAEQYLQLLFAYKRRRMFDHLRLGEGLFWERKYCYWPDGEIRRSVIEIRALKNLIEYFVLLALVRGILHQLL